MNLLSRFTRYGGIFLIVIASISSMLFSSYERDFSYQLNEGVLSYFTQFENRFYDFRAENEWRKHKKNSDIVLAKIDDKTIQGIGRWPMPRKVYADTISKLDELGAKVIVFDVIFPEASLSCSEISDDELLANSISQFQQSSGQKVIISYGLADTQSPSLKELPVNLYNFILDSQQPPDTGFIQSKVSSETYPIEKILQADPGLGYINMSTDADGVFRHYPVVANIDTLYLPSLGLLAYEALNDEKVKLEVFHDGSGVLKTKKSTLPLTNKGEAKVRFHGGSDKFLNISLIDIIDKNKDQQELKQALNGKTVFIGSTAVAAHDLRNTPVDSKLPGVYFHMNLLNMLDNNFVYQKTESSLIFSLLILLLGVLVILIAQYFDNPFLDLIGLLISICGAWFSDSYYFLPRGYELKLFSALNCFLLIYVWDTFLNFYQASKDKKQIKGAFSRYVSPAIVSEVLKHPETLKVGGEKIDITCMFSDVRDFTSISEALTAEQLGDCLNYYMGKMTDIVFATKGTLDKYIGDAVVALWGAPIKFDNHPQLAVEAAIEMIEALPRINEELTSRGYPEFKIGIGLNSGECSVGNMGSDQIFSYTALGDNMNLGARLEGLCKFYGAKIIISEYTKERLNEAITCRMLDNVKVKGKTKPVVIYEVLDRYHPFKENQKALDDYHQAYKLYLQQEFEQASSIFQQLLEKYPDDKSCQRLNESCMEFLKFPPPPEWDGVTTYKVK